ALTDGRIGARGSSQPTRGGDVVVRKTTTLPEGPVEGTEATHAASANPDSATALSGWTPPTWEEIVRQHSARVYRLAYRLTGNQHDAEDLTQEVFVRVFRSLSTYSPGTFQGWLHRITTNLFLDQARRK